LKLCGGGTVIERWWNGGGTMVDGYRERTSMVED